MAKYINTSVTQVIITKDVNNSAYQYTGDIKSISLCNNSTGAAIVSLTLNAYEVNIPDYSVLKDVNIPPGVVLLLDHDISFDVNTYALDFYNSGVSPDVTIVIK